ncbi:hypothetical protein QM012_002631 [Aureobasidium pullulans]|uniref:Zn(2)-C6 fungal-type domain-containing protein n=1 Tax=Aureobasidium pullulans TaxID=5580 RepID=A0ABR0TBE3_AURPU
MAESHDPSGLDAFDNSASYSPQIFAHNYQQEDVSRGHTEADYAASTQTSDVNSVSSNLRVVCDPCRILHRTCRNGSPTKPCDRCVERNVTCVFGPRGSYVPLLKKRKRARRSTNGEDPEPESKRVIKNATIAAPGFDPVALGLRRRCNYCHLRARACVNGSNTTPCDTCKEKNLNCTFGALKSIIDKNDFIKTKATDHGQERAHVTTAQNADTMEQRYPRVEGVKQVVQVKEVQEVKKVEEFEDVEPRFDSAQERGYLLFPQKQAFFQQDYTMHPWETLTARHVLGYSVLRVKEETTNMEADEE